MKMLLVALQLGLTPPVPVPGAEAAVSTPQPENPRVHVIEFEDTPLEDFDSPASEWECFPGRHHGTRSRLVRIRENFDDKVMQSVAEM
jgi:hypothetical protein